MPLLDEMLMIDPPPARRIDGTTDFMPSIVPVRFTSTTLRNFSTSCFSIGREVEDAGVVHEDASPGRSAPRQSATAATHSSSDVTSRWR